MINESNQRLIMSLNIEICFQVQISRTVQPILNSSIRLWKSILVKGLSSWVVYLIYLCYRQYALISLEALKMIIEIEHNAYFIHQNYLVARTSSPDQKLKTALHLYKLIFQCPMNSLQNQKLLFLSENIIFLIKITKKYKKNHFF